MVAHLVLNPVIANPIFGGLGQNVLPFSVHSNMQLVKPDNERMYCRERKVEKGQKSRFAESSSGFFSFFLAAFFFTFSSHCQGKEKQQELRMLLKHGGFC